MATNKKPYHIRKNKIPSYTHWVFLEFNRKWGELLFFITKYCISFFAIWFVMIYFDILTTLGKTREVTPLSVTWFLYPALSYLIVLLLFVLWLWLSEIHERVKASKREYVEQRLKMKRDLDHVQRDGHADNTR